MLTESKFLELYHRQQDSGLTVKDFCSNEGIAASSFYYWRKKLRKNNVERKNFIPLVVKPSSSLPTQRSPSVQEHKDMPDHTAGGDDMLLELVYPNGTRLRIKNDMDLSHLRALICIYD